ncbi:MAG: transcription termination factor Rho [bacterium]
MAQVKSTDAVKVVKPRTAKKVKTIESTNEEIVLDDKVVANSEIIPVKVEEKSEEIVIEPTKPVTVAKEEVKEEKVATIPSASPVEQKQNLSTEKTVVAQSVLPMKSVIQVQQTIPVLPSNPLLSSNYQKDRTVTTMSINDLDVMNIADLRVLAKTLKIVNNEEFKKNELILKILEQQTSQGGNIYASGFLEIMNDGTHGVLRSLRMLPSESDVYVSGSQIKRFNLRKGDFVSGQARPPRESEKYLSMLKIQAINGRDPEKATTRPSFERLTAVFPNKQIILETGKDPISTRVVDLLAPVGKGQRGMIVAPPKSGKTILLKEMAIGIKENSPEIHLMIVLIGERPEEVTDIQRLVKAEVIASNFDESPQDQTKVAEMALERAKRLVEMGEDVVILMDSITRLARAYNIVAPASGRTLSGGIDPAAVYPSKKFFGAARNFEEGGSLTILATALVDTGSRMDDVIFEEFKGTGNMELKLDRKLADKRIFPAIDILQSGTRNEELLVSKDVIAESWRIRRMLDALNPNEASEVLINRLKKTKDNKEFLFTLHEQI